MMTALASLMAALAALPQGYLSLIEAFVALERARSLVKSASSGRTFVETGEPLPTQGAT
jgi:hypothetical protein